MLISPFTGGPVVAQQTHVMTRAALHRFLEFDALLQQMGWQIICARCADRFGTLNLAGVRGDNDVQAQTYRVECACSAHLFDASSHV